MKVFVQSKWLKGPVRHTLGIGIFALGFMFLMGACSLVDTTGQSLNILSVKFSEGSPAVDGQTVSYSGSLLDVPSLDKFHFKMIFHVKADNSKNSGRAAFGNDAVKPVVQFRLNSKGSLPISTTVPAFAIAGGSVEDLTFPVEIPVSVIDPTLMKKIINGDPIPYFLSGTLAFNLFDGATILGAGKSDLDLASGEIATRPSGTVTSALSGLL